MKFVTTIVWKYTTVYQLHQYEIGNKFLIHPSCHRLPYKGVTKLVTFCEHRKYMTSKQLKLQPVQILEAVVSSSISSQIYFSCIENDPQHLSLHFSYDQTTAPVTFSCHLIFYVKNFCGLLNIASWLANKNPSFKQGNATNIVHIISFA